MVNDKNLQEKVIFIGSRKNPYPYYQMGDCVVLTSDFEGYPVVYIEALTLNKTIITTDVSDSKKDIDGEYGYVCSKDVNDIYEKMKAFIENGYQTDKNFEPEDFNKKIINKVENLINGED